MAIGHSSLRATIAAAALAATAGAACAHPHVWVTVESRVVLAPDRSVTAIQHRWTFDELYSSFAVQGLDKTGGNAPTREDLKELAQQNIESLKEFGYFTYPATGAEKAALKDPTDYYLEHKDGLLSLYFTVALETPARPAASQFHFSVYDPSFFIAFQFAKEKFELAKDSPVSVGAGAPAGCVAEVKQPTGERTATDKLSESFFQALGPGSNLGAQMADVVVVTCKD